MRISQWLIETARVLRKDERKLNRRKLRSRRIRSRDAIEQLEDRALLASFSPTTPAALIADINTANANGEDDVIDLGDGVFTLNDANWANDTTDGRNGLPAILSDTNHTLTIRNGDIERDGAASGFRFFHVADGAELNLDDIRLTNGLADQSGFGRAGGAAFVSFGGTMNVTGSALSDNTANGPGGGLGGALCNYGSLTLTNSKVSGNTSNYIAGGIYSRGTVFEVTDSTITDNTAVSNVAGGINNAGPMTISNSTISGNTSGNSGGGIRILFGTVTIANSTISGNSSRSRGGGIYNRGDLTVSNSTISGNTSSRAGGGIGNDRDLMIQNSLVAGNYRYDTSPGDIEGSTFRISGSHNLIGDAATSGGLTHGGVNGNIIGDGGTGTIDINSVLNTTLADNGGPTLTHALVTGSPAIDAGDNSLIPVGTTFDQRGDTFDRVKDGTVDIGAVEFGVTQPSPEITSVTTDADIPGSTATGNPVSLTAVVANVPPGPATTVTIDWGDGSPPENGTLSGDSVTGSHSYATGGVFTVTLTITVGSEAVDASTTATISGVGVQDGTLNIVGTSGLDQVIIQRRSASSYLIRSNTLGILNVNPSTFEGGFNAIHVQLGEGNDRFNALGTFETPLIVDAGAGNDRLVGSRGGDVLLGGEGNDYIWAGSGNNIVIGGTGRDFIFGGSGQDILIGGTTDFDSNGAALFGIQAEWTLADSSTSSLQTRVQNLSNYNNGGGGGLNDNHFLNSATVHDDTDRDLLFGGAGTDWLFYTPSEDVAYGALRDLFANDLDSLFD